MDSSSCNGRNDGPAPDANQSAGHAVPDNDTSIADAPGNIEGSPDSGAPHLTKLVAFAYAYHASGFNVVTVGGDKRPNLDSWRHWTRSHQGDVALERLPFEASSGLALICGEASGGYACLDFDKVEGDRSAFLARMLEGLGLPEDYAWAVISPGGVHVWLKVDDIEQLLGGKGKLTGDLAGCHHVELRYNGHFTIVPPTVRSDGGEYTFASGADEPLRIPPSTVDSERVAALAAWNRRSEPFEVAPRTSEASSHGVSSAYLQKALAGEAAKVAAAAEGTRHDTLLSAARSLGGLVHLGLDEAVITEALTEAGLACGLDADEVAKTIRDGLRYGKQAPRSAPAGIRLSGGRPAYPLHVLPDAIRTFVEEAAACVGCPQDMVAVPLVGYAAATVGRSYRIQIKRGYEKHPVLWSVVIGAPGSGKSPADAVARSFVEALQAKAHAEWESAHRFWKAEHKLWEQQTKQTSGTSPWNEEPAEPQLEHFYTTDATIEAIAPMVKSSAGLAGAHDEVVGWVKSMDAYTGSAGRERAQYLSLWAERSLKVDRKGKEPILVEDPVVCIVGGVQPDLLGDLAGEAGKRDGFVDRFLWSWPKTKPTSWSEEGISSSTTAAVGEVFARLRMSVPHPDPVVLSAEAKALWRTWYDENQQKTADADDMMKGIYAKADVHLARLALILHVLDHDNPTAIAVSQATLQHAEDLVAYHLAHARAVMTRLRESANHAKRGKGSTLHQRILAVLAEAGDWMLASEISVALGGHTEAEERDRVLDALLAGGLTERRVKASSSKGGRPGVQWRLASTSKLENRKAA
jgi:hypothetical protein